MDVDLNSSQVIAPLSPDKDSACVAAASIPCYVAKLPAQAREDVLYSTLLAQLGANNRYPQMQDRELWYKIYSESLANLGWSKTKSLFEKYNPESPNLRIADIVLKIIQNIVISKNRPEYRLAQDVFTDLEDTKNEAPFKTI